jgi:hypothetical protein
MKDVPYQTKTEDYAKPKVFVATPCYAGQVHVKFMECVMALQHALITNGIGFEFFTIPFDSLIPRARNASVTRFMASEDATHLLFVDADIQFHPLSVIKMLRENKDVICGCYPKKALDFESLKKHISKIENTMELIQSSVNYAFNFKPQSTHRVEHGVVEVLDAPTGFMMVRKQVFRDLMRTYPESEYRNDVRAYQVTPDDRFFNLFPSQVFDGRYLSEDCGFCRLYQKTGGQIFADLTVKLNHYGQFCYFGDPMLHLRNSNGVQITDAK